MIYANLGKKTNNLKKYAKWHLIYTNKLVIKKISIFNQDNQANN